MKPPCPSACVTTTKPRTARPRLNTLNKNKLRSSRRSLPSPRRPPPIAQPSPATPTNTPSSPSPKWLGWTATVNGEQVDIMDINGFTVPVAPAPTASIPLQGSRPHRRLPHHGRRSSLQPSIFHLLSRQGRKKSPAGIPGNTRARRPPERPRGNCR